MRPHPRGSSIESTQILDSTLLRWQTVTCSRLVSLTPSGFIGTILPPYSHPHYFESSSQRQPTYVVGKCPTLHPNVEVKASTFSTAPTEINSLFSKLFLNLDTTSNHIKDNSNTPKILDQCHKRFKYLQQTRDGSFQIPHFLYLPPWSSRWRPPAFFLIGKHTKKHILARSPKNRPKSIQGVYKRRPRAQKEAEIQYQPSPNT